MARWILLLPVLSLLLGGTAVADPLRVGMFTDFEPLVFKVSEEIQGVEVDFASLVASEIDRPLEVRTYRFQELINALERGEIDVIMSGFSVTEERSQRVRYVTPYMQIGQMGIVRREDAKRFSTDGEIDGDGVRIGVHQGTTGEAHVREHYRHAIVQTFGGVEAGLAALREGRIDVFVHDSTTSWQLGRSFVNDGLVSLGTYLTRESIAWAVSKDDQVLQATLNQVMVKFREAGVVDEVLRRWLPTMPSSATSNPEE